MFDDGRETIVRIHLIAELFSLKAIVLQDNHSVLQWPVRSLNIDQRLETSIIVTINVPFEDSHMTPSDK